MMRERLWKKPGVRAAFRSLLWRRRRQEFWRQQCENSMRAVEILTGRTRGEVEVAYGEWLQARQEEGGG